MDLQRAYFNAVNKVLESGIVIQLVNDQEKDAYGDYSAPQVMYDVKGTRVSTFTIPAEITLFRPKAPDYFKFSSPLHSVGEFNSYFFSVDQKISSTYVYSLLPRELFILAHEYGHHISFLYGHRNEELDISYNLFNDNSTLSSYSRGVLLEEERLAWCYAESFLNSWGILDDKNLREKFNTLFSSSLVRYIELFNSK